MKKIYALLMVGMCATATAMASQPIQIQLGDNSGLTPVQIEPQQQISAEGVLESLGIDLNNRIELSPEAVSKMKAKISKTKAPMKVEESGEWIELGVGKITDGLLWSLLYADGDMYSNQWLLGVDKWSTENVYNFYQPYYYGIETINKWIAGTVIDYEPQYGSDSDNIWLVDATDKSKVIPSSFYTGMNVLYEKIGHVYVFSADDVIEMGANISAVYGTLSNGKVTLPKGSLFYWLPEYAGHQADVFGFKYDTTVELPAGGEDKAVTLTVPSYCPDERMIINVKRSNEVAQVYYDLITGEYPASEANLQYIVQQGRNATNLDEFNIELNCEALGLDNYQIATFFAVGVDANKKIIEGSAESFYIKPSSKNWVKMSGKATLTDYLVAGYFTTYTNELLVCDIEQHATKSGYYRLVNPYTTDWKYNTDNKHSDVEHDHYLYINAIDPDKVYIEESLLGLDLGDGDMAVIGLAHNSIKNGATPNSSWYGKLANNKATFPARSIAISERYYNNRTWYYTNTSGNLALTIPQQQNAVDGIAVDGENQAPVYYNLQGVRVDNPVPGQLMIVRRGDITTKELVK